MFPQTGTQTNASPHQESSQSSNLALIVPGKSAGPLSLGVSREIVQQIFPFKKDVDQEVTYTSCAPRTTWINWLDSDASGDSQGNVFVYIRDGHVFQIASLTPRFRTAEGIRTGSSPALVARYYKELKAYTLTSSGGQMFGFRDFICWVSREKGIAFSLAYNRRTRSRDIYEVIVFAPGSEYLPEGCVSPPSEWLNMPPYSLSDIPAGSRGPVQK
jgi:hypothetical protein